MFGWQDNISVEVFWALTVVAGLALLVALVMGIRSFRWPNRSEAVARVDAAMPGRPIAAIADTQAIGAGDAASEAVWQAHMARMAEQTQAARAVEPDLKIADRDPFGLRFIALLFFVAALLFGSLWRVSSVADIASGGPTLASGPVWEGWVTPPAYTGKPTLYLNDIPEGPLRVPAGSEITLRLYGEVGALTVAETLSQRVDDIGAASDAQQAFDVVQSGTLAIEGEGGAVWDVTVVNDQAPLVELTGPIEADATGEMSQPFLAMDDYGVEAGTATITLDLAAVDRSYGLAAAPDDQEALVLDLPMPFSGDRTDFEEVLLDDLSEHPLANLPVTLTLEVTDAAGQVATSVPEPVTLPGRRFFQPFARAVIEQRRDLMWSKANAPRIVQVLKAISHRPEGLFSNEVTYLRMRAITRRLDAFQDNLPDNVQDELVQAMWDLAIQLEDGTLADARERLRRAQERLSEAMRNGASDAEIAELMQELREATDDYMQMLADQMEPEENTDQADSGQEGQEITQDQIQALMDRIQELMEEGRMAEAEALMEQLNELLENLRITQGQGSGDETNPGQQQGQQQGQQGQGEQGENQGQQGQQQGDSGQDGQQGQGQGVGEEGQNGQTDGNGAGGEGEGDAGGLAERQQALRDELERQRGNLPSLDGEAGEIARRSLDRAEGAMDGAEDALRQGDLAEAIDRQAEAMDALRNGMRSLSEALAQNQGAEPGQGSEQGEATGRPTPGQRDPLGRELGNTGQAGTDQNILQGQDVYRRAEEILDEIRRRSAQQDRPEIERDYLERLLDRF